MKTDETNPDEENLAALHTREQSMPATPSTFLNLAQGQGAVRNSGTGAPNCTTCPSFLSINRQETVLGKAVGGNVCAKRLIAIGRPTLRNEAKAAATIASKCPEYGKDITFNTEAHKTAMEIPVAFPDMVAQTTPGDTPGNVISCRDCKNFVHEAVTEEKIGWKAGFCTAKGTLLLSDRLHAYAKGCESRSYTNDPLDAWSPASRKAAVEINLLPEHMAPVALNSPLAILRRMKEGGDDPGQYPTDKPVSPMATRLGVRAWRKVPDPKGYGPNVFLPVFDLHAIQKESYPDGWDLGIELAKVPQTGDDEHPEWYVDHGGFVYRIAVLWTRLEETPALWGPAGVGKTELLRHMAWLMQLPFERVSITGSTELDDIAGKMLYTQEQGTYFHKGRVPRAWGKPNVLCIDEPNVGPPDVWQFLRPLTDNSKQLVLDQDKGQKIKAHKACYLGMAMNPAWDPRNVGAMELGDADGSRLMHLHMGLPPREIEEAIILQRVLADGWEDNPETKQIIKTLMNVAVDLRNLSDEGTIPISWGIRPQIKVARAKKYLSWLDAYSIGVADSLEPQARSALMDVVRSQCPEEN